jgi:hypothetical protein
MLTEGDVSGTWPNALCRHELAEDAVRKQREGGIREWIGKRR